MGTKERGRAPDHRELEDIAAVERCRKCGTSPAAIILTEDGWECYNCGYDPDG